MSSVVSSNGALLNMNAAPLVSVQPIVSQTVCAGSNVTVSVVATGLGPLSYQWKRGVTNVGVNSPVLTLSSVVLGDAGNYTVVVSGGCAPSVTSNISVLVIDTAPTIVPTP